MKTTFTKGFFLAFLTLVFYNCKIKYSFTGASISPDVKTISIGYFKNNASIVQPLLSQTFTEALKDKFLSQTNLTLVEKNGDLQFEGEITNYNISPTAIQGNETAALNRLTITVNVRFTNTKNETQNFEKNFSRYADYESTQNLSAIEEQLIKTINEMLVEDIFNQTVANW